RAHRGTPGGSGGTDFPRRGNHRCPPRPSTDRNSGDSPRRGRCGCEHRSHHRPRRCHRLGRRIREHVPCDIRAVRHRQGEARPPRGLRTDQFRRRLGRVDLRAGRECALEYELATEDNATWQSAPAQVGCAATWIQDHADTLGADMDRLAFWAESSGGNMVANTAGAAAQGASESSCGGEVPVPDAVVADYPAFDVTGMYENAPAGPGAGTGTRIFATSFTGGTPGQFPKRYAAVN